MKIFFLSLIFSTISFAANVVTNPASSGANTISPSAASVEALTVDNSSSASSAEVNLHVKSAASANPAVLAENSEYDALQGVSEHGVGIYGHSGDYVGIYGDSTQGISGYFVSNSSTNFSPLLVSQDLWNLGVNVHLLELQDYSGAALMSVDAQGKGVFNAGVVINSSISKPACVSSHRGHVWVVQGGAGVADLLQVCLKDAANNYAWVSK